MCKIVPSDPLITVSLGHFLFSYFLFSFSILSSRSYSLTPIEMDRDNQRGQLDNYYYYDYYSSSSSSIYLITLCSHLHILYSYSINRRTL